MAIMHLSKISFLIASRFTQSDDTIITIPMDTVYDLSKGSYHNTHLFKMTQALGKRIANLNFYKTVKLDDGKIGLRIGHLFTYIDITSDYIRCSLDPLFVDYFQHISNPFTVFDLEEFVNLKSKYSKTLYRCLLDLKIMVIRLRRNRLYMHGMLVLMIIGTYFVSRSRIKSVVLL